MKLDIGIDPVSETPWIGVSFNFNLFSRNPMVMRGQKPGRCLGIHWEFKLEDFWIGVYWRRNRPTCDLQVWVCPIPMFPIHISWSLRYD
jgi:hypothetical protein